MPMLSLIAFPFIDEPFICLGCIWVIHAKVKSYIKKMEVLGPGVPPDVTLLFSDQKTLWECFIFQSIQSQEQIHLI